MMDIKSALKQWHSTDGFKGEIVDASNFKIIHYFGKAYAIEHPSDDDDPLDEGWMRIAGFLPDGDVAAESVSQARYRTTLAAASAGWPPKWTAIRVVRAPEWDAWAAVDESGRCWSENYLVHFDIPGTKKVCSRSFER